MPTMTAYATAASAHALKYQHDECKVSCWAVSHHTNFVFFCFFCVSFKARCGALSDTPSDSLKRCGVKPILTLPTLLGLFPIFWQLKKHIQCYKTDTWLWPFVGLIQLCQIAFFLQQQLPAKMKHSNPVVSIVFVPWSFSRSLKSRLDAFFSVLEIFLQSRNI